MFKKVVVNGRVFMVLFLSLLVSLYAGWMVNAQLGYGYAWLYEFYETEQHIAHYAPQNRFRQGFETTSVAEHKRVFQQIVDSVHNNGEGLAEIQYEYLGQDIALLHEAERIHLQDVANLINEIHLLVLGCWLLLLLLLYWEYRYQSRSAGQVRYQASASGLLGVFLLLLLVIIAVFSIWGAKAIFYHMHTLVFPDDHQWFFYYQDSLMSTLMKAPDLFAGIAVQIVLVGGLVFGFALLLMKRLLNRSQNRSQKRS